MLSGEALDLAFALRDKVGALSQGDGPSLQEVRRSIDLSEPELVRALAELESVGFIGVERHSGGDASIVVLAPLQIYLDDLENQGTDDL